MSTKPNADTSVNKEGEKDAANPPGGMHGPHHCALDMAEIAAQDEVQHEDALRHSSLRVPR
ncbi:hypothetical protein [Dyella flagellata]|uniref:Uncharacterized protein n=1 Tax=Dyella flagellata TaxID=1867833 RepID=A0ABQ5XGG7_9GAMM|nr:hypothetical protein [Dyella flagellata]GLQ90738.1 hypothetical protein GCM10007898_43140 [Dyella flagellata]